MTEHSYIPMARPHTSHSRTIPASMIRHEGRNSCLAARTPAEGSWTRSRAGLQSKPGLALSSFILYWLKLKILTTNMGRRFAWALQTQFGCTLKSRSRRDRYESAYSALLSGTKSPKTDPGLT
jgi:hypothetical protein